MESEIPNNSPIFIVGSPRSGTTLLRYILTSHPRIYIPPESYFFHRFFSSDPQRPVPPEKAVEVMASICTYEPFFADWKGERPNPELFVSMLPDTRPAAIICALYTLYARQYGAERWGDKTPIYVEQIDKISALFPEGKFIHIIRDGRDVAVSMRKAYRNARYFYMDIYYAAANWKDRLARARKMGDLIGPERYLEIRYEDLVSNMEESICNICGFIGEVYHPAMLEPQLVAARSHHSTGIHSSTRQPPTDSHIGHWQKEMSPADQRLFQSVAGDILEQNKYALVDLGKMPPVEVLRKFSLAGKFYTLNTLRNSMQKAGIVHPTAIIEKFTK